jgi:hypothetical protein
VCVAQERGEKRGKTNSTRKNHKERSPSVLGIVYSNRKRIGCRWQTAWHRPAPPGHFHGGKLPLSGTIGVGTWECVCVCGERGKKAGGW